MSKLEHISLQKLKSKLQYYLRSRPISFIKIKTPNKVGTQSPKKIPCDLSPEINKYSATRIIRAQRHSIRKLDRPIFFNKFINNKYFHKNKQKY